MKNELPPSTSVVSTTRNWYHQLFELTFNIRPAEFRLVQFFLIYGILILSAYTMFSTSAFTLFLSQTNSATLRWLLPYNMMGIALSAIVVTWGYQKLIDAISRIALITWTTAFFSGCFLLLRWLIAYLGGHPWLYFSLVIAEETFLIIIVMIFYSYLGDYFNVQNARRLYGYINGGLALGTPLGGFGSAMLLHYITVTNLIYAAILLLVLSNIIAYIIWKTVAVPQVQRTEVQKTYPFLMRRVFTNKYLIIIFIIGIIVPISIAIEGYQFSFIASQHFNEVALGRFMGKFFGYIGIIQIIISFVLAGWLFRKLGILKNLLILPVLFIICSIGFIIYPIFPIAATFRFVDVALTGTLSALAIQMLFLPLSQRIRVYSQSLFCGIISSGGTILGGLILIALLFFAIPLRWYSALILGCCMIFIACILYLLPLYRKALAASLSHIETDPLDMQRLLNSSVCNRIIPELISHANTQKIVTILQWLPLTRLKKIKFIIKDLLQTNNDTLIIEGLNILAVFADEKDSQLVENFLTAACPKVQSAAIAAFCCLRQEQAYRTIEKYFNATTTIIVKSSLISAYRHCGKSAKSHVIDQVNQLLNTNKILALAIIEKIADPAFAHSVISLLDDENEEVQMAALLASKHYPNALMIKKIISWLETKSSLSFAAEQILFSMPRTIIDEIKLHFYDRSLSKHTRSILLLALGKIGGEQAIQIILEVLLSQPTPELLARSYQALQSFPLDQPWSAATKNKMDLCQAQFLNNLIVLKDAYLEMKIVPHRMRQLYFDTFCFYTQLLFTLLSIRYKTKELTYAIKIIVGCDEQFSSSYLELLESVTAKKLFLQLKAILLTPFTHAAFTSDAPTTTTIEKLLTIDTFVHDLTLFTVRALPADGKIRGGISSMTAEFNQSSEYIDTIIFLKQTELFKDIPESPCVSIVDAMHKKTYTAGEYILKEEEQGDQLLIILTGKVSIERQQKEIIQLSPGEVFGTLTLMDNLPYVTSARALENTQLLCLDTQEFNNILEAYPKTAMGLLRVLSSRLRKIAINLT